MLNSFFGRFRKDPSIWGEKSPHRFIKSGLEELVFNRNMNWRGKSDYSFLYDVRSVLKKLTIIDFDPGVDIRVLNDLEIDTLVLEVGVKAKWPNDFPQSIRHLKFSYDRASPSVTGLESLEELWIWGKCDWVEIPSFHSKTLHLLSVDSSKLSSLACDNLHSLRELIISNVKNINIDGLKHMPMLENLEIIDSKGVIDLSPINKVLNLKKLTLDGRSLRTLSIQPLGDLPNLEYVYLGETKVEDGNLLILERNKNLKFLFFKDRNDYNVSLAAMRTRTGAKRIGS